MHALGIRSLVARLWDFALLVTAFAAVATEATTLSRSGMFVWPSVAASDIGGWPAQYVVMALGCLLAWIAVSSYSGIYQRDQRGSAPQSVGLLIRTLVLWTAVTGITIFLLKLRDVSRLFMLSFFTFASILVVLRQYCEMVLQRWTRRRRKQLLNAVVVGTGLQAELLSTFLSEHFRPEPYDVVERLDPHDAGGLEAGVASPAAPAQPRRVMFVVGADAAAAIAARMPRLLKHGDEAHLVPTVFDASIFRLALAQLGGIPMITMRAGALNRLEALLKRILDFAIAAIALVILSPLTLVIAILIRSDSGGPLLFRQERLGKDGVRFRLLKFRTMAADAEEVLRRDRELYQKYVANNFKLPKDEDPRVTRLGRFLRETSLDEIPQLINVLKGEMSLVGPRPIVPAELERYGDYAELLLSVQPGLTGQWQVSGRSTIVDYNRRVRMDMEYIRDQSISTDLQILFRTVPAVVLKEGAH